MEMGCKESTMVTEVDQQQQQKEVETTPPIVNTVAPSKPAAVESQIEVEVGAPRVIGLDEIKVHNKNGDCWLVINKKVYDVSNYMESHPGGFDILLENSNGLDATEAYDDADHTKRAKEMLIKYYIGDIA